MRVSVVVDVFVEREPGLDKGFTPRHHRENQLRDIDGEIDLFYLLQTFLNPAGTSPNAAAAARDGRCSVLSRLTCSATRELTVEYSPKPKPKLLDTVRSGLTLSMSGGGGFVV